MASISRKASDIAWQSASGSGRQDESTQYNKIDGQITLNAAQLNVQGSAATLQQAATALAQQPGLEWLGQLQADPALASKVDWQKINEAHQSWQYNQQGLTPAGAAIITLIVALFTAGAGTAAAGSAGTAGAGAAGAAGTAATVTTGATWAGAYGAAMTAAQGILMSQAAVTMINTGGNIGDTLKQMSSKDSVRALITAMVTAGAINALGNTITYSGSGGNIPPGQLGTPQMANDFSGNLLKNITNNLASATIDAAINGKPLNTETLADSLKSALITAGIAKGAYAIGDAKVTDDLNAFTHKVAHAILGCAAGAAMDGGSCATGAVGGVVGELAAEFYNPTGTGNKAQTEAFAKLMAGVAGAMVSGDGNDAGAVNVAAATGGNAAANNYLKHTERAQLNQALQSCYTQGNNQACQTAAALQRKDELSDKLLANATASCQGSDCNEVSKFIQNELSALGCSAPSACPDYKTLNDYWQVAQAKAQGLEPVYPEAWLLDAKAVLDLGKLGVRAVTNLTSSTKDSLQALGQLSRTDAQKLVNNSYRDGASPELLQQTLNQAAINSTRNPHAAEVILGRHIPGSPMSYEAVAKARGSTYFSVSDWNVVQGQLGADQMWKINKAFLDQQIIQGKNFVFTVNPLSAPKFSFTGMEAAHLISNGYQFEQISGGLYRAIKP